MMKFIAVVLFAAAVAAQVQHGGAPTEASLMSDKVDVKVMPGFDVGAFVARARAESKNQQGGNLFAHPFPVSYSPLNSGAWDTLADGTKVWRLAIVSEGARSLNLFFSQYVLAEGNSLFVYSADRSIVRGAFTAANNKVNHRMAVAPIRADSIVVELIVAPGADVPELEIGIVNHEPSTLGYGDSGSCNMNSECEWADPFRDEVDSSAMILSAAGSRRCSGAMINNAANADRQLFLTAYHCLGGSDDWIFVFNYQSETCPQSTQNDGPTDMSVQGSSIVASGQLSDFALLELTESIPASYNIYYSGYNAVDEGTLPFGIHHPSGDIKKVAYSLNATTSDQWYGTPDTHWLVARWNGPGEGNQDLGDRTTTEPGSSGSPIHDEEGRITGQLHGGAATCSNPVRDLYGKVSYSFDNDAAFRNALDPNGGTTRLVSGRRA